MGFRLRVTGGGENLYFDERQITNVKFHSESPKDSNARATDYGLGVEVWGKMLFKRGAGDNDQTIGLAQWSQVPSHRDSCYRNIELEVVSASQVVRKYTIPDAFLINFTEELDDEAGFGTFYLNAREKKDENRTVRIEGGFGATEA